MRPGIHPADGPDALVAQSQKHRVPAGSAMTATTVGHTGFC
jgi:hypothetical protein